MNTRRPRYHRHRFPPEIIRHAVWLYHRYCMSFRDVEDLLAERGIIVSYETVRQWCGKFGPDYARQLKRRQGRLGDTWFLDEVSPTRRTPAPSPPPREVGKRLAHQLIEATGAQVALQEFQPGVRREANVIELQRQIPIDTGMQIGFSSSHGQWPFMCGRRRWVAPPFNHTGRPFSIPKRHCSLRKMTH